jgi:hypothetical protein
LLADETKLRCPEAEYRNKTNPNHSIFWRKSQQSKEDREEMKRVKRRSLVKEGTGESRDGHFSFCFLFFYFFSQGSGFCDRTIGEFRAQLWHQLWMRRRHSVVFLVSFSVVHSTVDTTMLNKCRFFVSFVWLVSYFLFVCVVQVGLRWSANKGKWRFSLGFLFSSKFCFR